ncbi:hypothetical protein OG349_29655 [Streptomyces sp. NBC_01317]|nr:hypothetical protein OG349_29655 [Streptomyces sp. NBC_01317]
MALWSVPGEDDGTTDSALITERVLGKAGRDGATRARQDLPPLDHP